MNEPAVPEPAGIESSSARIDTSGGDDLTTGQLERNRKHWDERVPIHLGSDFYDIAGFTAGREALDELAARIGAADRAEFVAADVYDAPEALGGRRFDRGLGCRHHPQRVGGVAPRAR